MYLRILHHYYRLTKDDFLIALDLCDRIKAYDPDFAPAYYFLAILVFSADKWGSSDCRQMSGKT